MSARSIAHYGDVWRHRQDGRQIRVYRVKEGYVLFRRLVAAGAFTRALRCEGFVEQYERVRGDER